MSDDTRLVCHEEVEAKGLVDRYYRGDLDPDLEARFEDHFFGCAACQEALATAGDFRDALRDLAARDVITAMAAAGTLARLRRRAPWLVAVLALAPALWLVLQVGELRTAAEDAEAGAEAARTELQTVREAAERRFTELSARLESAAAGALTEPLSNLPLILLERTRGGDDVPVLAADAAITLAIDAAGGKAESFEVTVRDGAGALVLERAAQRPDVLGLLRITFPAGYFAPGEYRVEVMPSGVVEPFVVYGFRVIEPAEDELRSRGD